VHVLERAPAAFLQNTDEIDDDLGAGDGRGHVVLVADVAPDQRDLTDAARRDQVICQRRLPGEHRMR